MDNYNYTSQASHQLFRRGPQPSQNHPEHMRLASPSSSEYLRPSRRHYPRVRDDGFRTSYPRNYNASEYQQTNQSPVSINRPTIYDPPSWASPARGDSSLEPIGGTAVTNPPVDLTQRRYFLIGRSPSTHLPLLHSTSSRKHALLFHHPNGSCYISDCHSAHGTYVDGVQVKPYPHYKRVRRGALIRFGGPGAPSFILKCFSVKLEEMVKDLGGVAEAYFPKGSPVRETPPIICESSSSEEDESSPLAPTTNTDYPVMVQPTPANAKQVFVAPATKNNGVLACIRGDGGGVACIAEGKDAPEAALVLLNTRINAVGKGAMKSECDREMARTAQVKFEKMGMKRQREENDGDELQFCKQYKRPKKSILKQVKSYNTDTTNPCATPKPAIVSDNVHTPYDSLHSTKSKRRVLFSDEKLRDFYVPTVSPEENTLYNEESRGYEWKRALTLPIL